ncbi:hypothetical protein HDU76_011417 [Blyttiomyces sp. JEL0837]|nr:hypothetical protein HDU76_011417 [Blyttiomyces sp. JEL0837]
MFMSIYGVSAFQATAIGWGWGVSILAISTVSFMFLDVVKVMVFRYWSYALTVRLWPTPSRVARLRSRQEKADARARVLQNFQKVKKAIVYISAARNFMGKRKWDAMSIDEKRLSAVTAMDNSHEQISSGQKGSGHADGLLHV